MLSAKHNSTMERAMGLISSLLDITLSQGVPFRQLQQLQSKHHGATFAYLCTPVLFADNARCQFLIAQIGLPLDLSCLSPCVFWKVTWIHFREVFLHCYLSKMCIEWSISTNEAWWLPDFSVYNWLFGHAFSCYVVAIHGSSSHNCVPKKVNN